MTDLANDRKYEPSINKFNALGANEEPDVVERLRFFCSIGFKCDDDWFECEKFFKDITDTIAQLQLDNERMREVLLKVRSIYTDSLNYKWITEALATQPTEYNPLNEGK